MSYKIKSSLYLASLIIAVLIYHNNVKANDATNFDLAQNNIENVSIHEAVN
jgi:hypothetical protein